MSWGYYNRISSLKYNNHFFIIPLDQGLTNGSIDKLNSKTDLEKIFNLINVFNIPGLVVNKGFVKYLPYNLKSRLILQTMGAPLVLLGNTKLITSTIDDAVSLNATMISVQTYFSEEAFFSMSEISRLISQADSINMPVLLMINNKEWKSIEDYLSAIRYGIEIGASLIKIDPANIFNQLINKITNLNQFDIPLLLPSGILHDEELIFQITKSLQIGYQGICVGRGIFQHSNPTNIIKQISELL